MLQVVYKLLRYNKILNLSSDELTMTFLRVSAIHVKFNELSTNRDQRVVYEYEVGGHYWSSPLKLPSHNCVLAWERELEPQGTSLQRHSIESFRS